MGIPKVVLMSKKERQRTNYGTDRICHERKKSNLSDFTKGVDLQSKSDEFQRTPQFLASTKFEINNIDVSF
jgi:hypothetical protein